MLKPLSALTLSLVALAGLLPATADAGDRHRRDREDRRPGIEVRVGNRRSLPPRPAPRPHGRYELHTVDVWVPGYSEQVWQEGHCKEHRRGKWRKCTDGHYVTRHVPGYYEQQQDWVWVPAHVHEAPVVVYPPAPVGWDVRVRL